MTMLVTTGRHTNEQTGRIILPKRTLGLHTQVSILLCILLVISQIIKLHN